MADYNLGTARGKIEVDSSGLVQSFTEAKATQKGFMASIEKSSTKLTLLGATTAAAGAGIVAGFAGATIAAASFEKGIDAIGAVSGASQKQLDLMRQKALDLGAETKFSAGEAASAMEELAKAGVSVTDILNGAADATVALAAAGEVALPEAATIASNAMNAFGLKAKDLPRVADLIAGAANASAIDVGEFGYSLQMAGSVANLAGISFDDLSVAIAQMGNAGIKGSDAGTSLKTMLMNLNPQTDKQIKLAKQLGIVTKDGANAFFDENGKAKSLADISQVLQNSFKGMTKQQKLAKMEILFGSDAIRAASVLTDQGAKGFDKMSRAMGKVKAADVAKARMDNLAGAFEELKGSIETMLIQIGTPFLDALKGIAEKATGVVNAFSKLSPATQEWIAKITLGIGILLLLGGTFMIAVVQTVKFISTMKTLKTTLMGFEAVKKATAAMKAFNLSLLTNPIVLIVVALIALGVAFYVLYKKSETFRRVVQTIWSALKDGIGIVVRVAKKIWSALNGAFNAIVDAGRKVIDFIKGNWKTVLLTMINPVGLILLAWKAFGPKILAALSDAGSAILDFLKGLPSKIAFALGFIVGSFIRFHITLVQTAVRIGVAVVRTLVSAFMRLPGLVWCGIQATLNFVKRLPGLLWNLLLLAAVKVYEFGVRAIKWAIAAGKGVVNGVINFIKSLPGKLWDLLVTAVNKIKTFATNAASAAADVGRSIYNGIVDGIKALPEAVGDILSNAISAIKSKIGEAFNAVKGFAKSMWDGFKKGLGINSPSFIEKQMFQINDVMASSVKGIGKDVGSLQRLARGVPNMTPALAGIAAPNGSQNASSDVFQVIVYADRAARAEDIKSKVKSPDVLTALVRAARAGSKSR